MREKIRLIYLKIIGLINTIYWLINRPFGIIVLNYWGKQICGKCFNHNFGDDLNPYLIRRITGKKVINYDNMLKIPIRNYCCIGSILEYMPTSTSIVWGSGAIHDGREINIIPKKVCSVRGPLTRKYLLERGVHCPEIYGDPALLVPYVYNPNIEKKYKLGIIPHYIDYYDERLKSLGSDVLIINLRNYGTIEHVIDQIKSCEAIASSSLHGLILADAYNIPNVWIKLSDKISGGMFKYQDYFMGVNREVASSIDFKDGPIDKLKIFTELKRYKPIQFDAQKLLDAAPFKVVLNF